MIQLFKKIVFLFFNEAVLLLNVIELLFYLLLLPCALSPFQSEKLQQLFFLKVLILSNLTIFVLGSDSEIKSVTREITRLPTLCGLIQNIRVASLSKALRSMVGFLKMQGVIQRSWNLIRMRSLSLFCSVAIRGLLDPRYLWFFDIKPNLKRFAIPVMFFLVF